ncbi:hypothetical protein BDF21DRAFT_184095 [Thamnidium elegans]|nr:hypothetical protein BDF21DRAFT_184095 [Thamnidium elegans]
MPSEKETVEIDDIFNADDMDVEDHLDYSSDPMEENESFEEFSYSDIYSVPYKTGCTFEENEGQSHIYHQNNNVPRECYRQLVRFANTIIRDIQKIHEESPNPKIMHGPAVDNLLKRHSNVKAHIYDACIQGCRLFNDDSMECNYCKSERFRITESGLKVPEATLKVISIGDVIAQLLSNNKTRELLRYRADRHM